MGAVPPPGVDISQGGVLKKSRTQKINFASGATVVDNGDSADVTVTGGAGSGVNTTDEGVAVDSPASTVNFAGAGVNATGGAGTTTITIPGAVVGLLAARPAAASANMGMIYFATDTNLLYISNGAAWTTMPYVISGVDVSQAGSINVNVVDNTKLAQMAANTIKGNNTAGLANAADLTVAQTKTLLGFVASGDAAGGDLTGTYPNPTVGTNKVTNAQLAQMVQATIRGRAAGAGTGNVTDLTAAQVKTLLAIANTDVSGLGTLSTINSPTPVANGGTALSVLPGAGKANVSDGSVFASDYPANAYSAWGPLGLTGTIAENHPRINAGFNATTITSGTLIVIALALSKGQLITSITFARNAVIGSATHQIFGLYNSSKALLRATNDDTNVAWAGNATKTLNLTSTFTTTYSGLYYVGCLVAATTPGTLFSAGLGVATMTGFAPILGGNTNNTGITALPDPFGTITASGNIPWVAVS